MTACIACYISNKFVYSISLSTNSPDEGPLLETSRVEYFCFRLWQVRIPLLAVYSTEGGLKVTDHFQNEISALARHIYRFWWELLCNASFPDLLSYWAIDLWQLGEFSKL